MRFEGKIALVTGGGTGIGAATARRIARDGGRVALVGRRREPLEAVAAEIGGMVFQADAADTPSMKRAVGEIVSSLGGIDILVANAGGHGFGPTIEMTDETWANSTRLNLDTAFVSARECLPQLIARGGNIVVLSSIAGLFAGPDAAGYVTMKHACIGFAKSLARDYGRRGVRTNTVCPGWVTTPMADEEMDYVMKKHGLASIEEAYRLVTKDVPLGRPAAPEDVANAVCFLASSEARMINGAILTVDGGAGTVDLPTLAMVD
ncbi:MAG: SDR family oxidoreductase [Rhizobiaceae bacterium]|nr:SDR family oxidoreductase [Rhizobiaceae bacterium]